MKKFIGFFSVNSWFDVLKHLTVIGLIGGLSLLGFFYIYLPISTDHGETVTVPDVVGVDYRDLDDFLTDRNLRFEISADSGYSSKVPPLSVLKQFPAANSKVKEKRKIYLTLNSQSPPLVRMPNLVEGSIKSAQLVLNMYDLKLGSREYVPDLFMNTVLEQKMNGEIIEEGTMIQKGSTIDVVLGDGLGQTQLEAPDLIGLDEESATIAIIGSGLSLGSVTEGKDRMAILYETDDEGNEISYNEEVSPGSVSRQHPIPGTIMRLKSRIDITIYRPDSLNVSSSILDRE